MASCPEFVLDLGNARKGELNCRLVSATHTTKRDEVTNHGTPPSYEGWNFQLLLISCHHYLVLMDFTISTPDLLDADHIAGSIEVPAMRNGPLFRTMFPLWDMLSERDRNEVYSWYADMLKDAFEDQKEEFCTVTSDDGVAVGFCGWAVIGRHHHDRRRKVEIQREKKKPSPKLPSALDAESWISLSQALREERSRVLSNIQEAYRITFMVVNPDYHRRGIGSMMMQRIVEDADQHARHGYVLATPEGVRLYEKFGFETVGCVETPYGTIKSMLRKARASRNHLLG